MRVFRQLVAHVVLPIFFGAAIYVLWRSDSLVLFSWLRFTKLAVVTNQLRGAWSASRHDIPASVIFCLPDALWVYAFTSATRQIWAGRSGSAGSVIWPGVPLLLPLVSEFGQRVERAEESDDEATPLEPGCHSDFPFACRREF
jgi:hypothetical protein